MKQFFKVLLSGIGIFLAISIMSIFFYFLETEFKTITDFGSFIQQICQIGLIKLVRNLFFTFLLIAVLFFDGSKSERQGSIPFFIFSYLFLLLFYFLASYYFPIKDISALLEQENHWLVKLNLGFDTLVTKELYFIRNFNFLLFALYLFVLQFYLLVFIRLVHSFEWKQLNFLFGIVLACLATYLTELLLGKGSSYLLEKMPFFKEREVIQVVFMLFPAIIIHLILSLLNRKYEVVDEE